MVGSDEEGDFSLDVYPVMLDDDAKYQCQVGPSPSGAYQIYHINHFIIYIRQHDNIRTHLT